MNLIVKHLHHVQICIPFGKEDIARQFYSTVLGFTEIEKPDALKPNGGLWYQVGDIELHIGTEQLIEKGKGHPAFEVENLDEIKSEFEQRAIRMKEEIQIPGMKRFSFFDPFGNRIEFLELVSC